MEEVGRRTLCSFPCTRAHNCLTDHEVPANIGVSIGPFERVHGYRQINILVRFTQEEVGEPPVDLGVAFAFDKNGATGARRYVNLDKGLPSSLGTSFITVSGRGTWHGSQTKKNSYVARFPVIGPYAQVFLYNRAPTDRTVTVWAYLVA
jgi:hypothetical protein